MRESGRDNFALTEGTGAAAEGTDAATGAALRCAGAAVESADAAMECTNAAAERMWGHHKPDVTGGNIRRAWFCRLVLVVASIVLITALSACGKRARQEKELREFAISLMNEGAYGAAIAKFDEALSMNDGSVGATEIDILKYRAQAEMLMGDYAAAEYTYTLLEREDRKRDEYTNLRIICMARAGSDMGRAVELYEKAEKENPYGTGHQEALYVLGEALSGSELDSQRAKAKEFYEAALADAKRKSGELYERLGMLLFNEGDVEGALEQFEKGMELIDSDEKYADDDARKSIRYNTAVCMEYQARWREALESFKEYEEIYGSTQESSHEIAFIEGILSERDGTGQ